MSMQKSVQIIGIPMDLGQNHRGVDMGPSAIRYAGLSNRLRDLGYTIKDIGNIHVEVRSTLRKKNLTSEIIKACDQAYLMAQKAIANKHIPIFIGGDHSISIGTIGGVTHEKKLGVIWIDAHGDFNTPETSMTQNIHGMALSVLVGAGKQELVNVGRKGPKLLPQEVVIIGSRSIDPLEKKLLNKSNIQVYTMRDIDEQGVSAIARKAVNHLSHLDGIHVSLDMDAIDPVEAPGVGTPVSGGLTYREAHLIMEIIADSERLSSLDIVEINPILDHKNQTGAMAVELAVSLFGKTIL